MQRRHVIVDTLRQDTRHAIRRLVRDWRFTAAAVVILGLGIGANTAIFSLINATLFRGQRFADPGRLVDIYQNATNAGGIDANSYPAYLVMAALPVISARTMAQYLEESLVAPKAVAAFLGGLGALGLCLAGIGLYAMVAFAVSRRSREIGIRMALGARSQQAVWTVAKDVALVVGIGTGVGLLLSLLAIVGLRGVSAPAPGISLYRPTAAPAALLSIAIFMALVALAAAYVPARRAARMDPLAALRHD